jgi:cation diffusion facilitator CzcD-associated flavoprotein CzcO
MPAPAPTFVIIGAGFGGLCIAMKLKRAGIDSFTILEKAATAGGTWRDNTYPGAACDIPSFHYCFSFEQRTSWSRKWAAQPEILDYVHHCIRKYDLARHIRYGAEVDTAHFDDDTTEWVVRTKAGDEFRARYLVSAVGQLNRPHVPDVRGLSSFRGPWFHSARWQKDIALENTDVAVIGNAASAVQFIPEIAPHVRRLTIFQRSPNWIMPKLDAPYDERTRRLLTRVPFLAFLYRIWLWYLAEIRFPILLGRRFFARLATSIATRHLETQIKDSTLRERLLPAYPIGAKRVLITDDYYPALQRDNVSLVTDPIDHVEPDGIVTADGARHAADAIIFATGFETTEFLVPMRISGERVCTLEESWRGGAEAYLGITVSGFPNFFLMYGPNTNLGHNSILFMLECQADYVVGLVEKVERRGFRMVDLRPDVMRAYNDRLRKELDKTVWAKVSSSWYKTKSGRITNNWYGPTWLYWLRTRRVSLAAYRTA